MIDTNIWVSYALNRKGVIATQLKWVISKHQYAFSETTFRELTEVLLREKFDPYFSKESRVSILKDIAREATWFSPKEVITDCRDPKDNAFLELAVAANAAAILTGEEDLLVLSPFRGIQIQKIADFTNVIE